MNSGIGGSFDLMISRAWNRGVINKIKYPHNNGA
jgi:hypothetical protein